MRLAFTSDLHVDHHPEVIDLVVDEVQRAEADVLIVAGDLTPKLDVLARSLAGLAKAAPDVVFVAGNHDLWCVGKNTDSQQRYLSVIPALCGEAGVHCLHLGPVVLGGVTLVGQSGWYDYSLRDTAFDDELTIEAYRAGRYKRLFWSDKQFVRWPEAEDDDALTGWMCDRLAGDLRRAPRHQPIVVTTHMLPFVELIHLRPPLPWSFVLGFLGSDRLGEVILSAAEAGAPIERVISGHTHFARRARFSAGTRSFIAETSPVGYPREYQKAGDLRARVTDRLRVVDIGEPGALPVAAVS